MRRQRAINRMLNTLAFKPRFAVMAANSYTVGQAGGRTRNFVSTGMVDQRRGTIGMIAAGAADQAGRGKLVDPYGLMIRLPAAVLMHEQFACSLSRPARRSLRRRVTGVGRCGVGFD